MVDVTELMADTGLKVDATNVRGGAAVTKSTAEVDKGWMEAEAEARSRAAEGSAPGESRIETHGDEAEAEAEASSFGSLWLDLLDFFFCFVVEDGLASLERWLMDDELAASSEQRSKPKKERDGARPVRAELKPRVM